MSKKRKRDDDDGPDDGPIEYTILQRRNGAVIERQGDYYYKVDTVLKPRCGHICEEWAGTQCCQCVRKARCNLCARYLIEYEGED